ncbi:MAG: hypothetical protein R3345_07850 [Fulvivirga sp.]|nr:hypothetical protein [Fulvivirga sp.]
MKKGYRMKVSGGGGDKDKKKRSEKETNKLLSEAASGKIGAKPFKNPKNKKQRDYNKALEKHRKNVARNYGLDTRSRPSAGVGGGKRLKVKAKKKSTN